MPRSIFSRYVEVIVVYVIASAVIGFTYADAGGRDHSYSTRLALLVNDGQIGRYSGKDGASYLFGDGISTRRKKNPSVRANNKLIC